VLGRPSPAAAAEPLLPVCGEAAGSGWRADGASTEWCTLRAASVVGVRHRLAGRPSDDAYAWALTAGRLAVAVADGVGSVDGSAGAAARAARAAVEAAVAVAGSDPIASALAAADGAAKGGGATTLVLAVTGADGSVALGRVGDSTAFLIEPDARWTELFGPPDPEHHDRATLALPGAADDAERGGARLVPGGVLALATDGVGDPWRDGPGTVAPALVSVLLGGPTPVELLAAADFSRQGCHDDRTILAVSLRADP
jgi:hypothetical protein